MKRSQSSSWQTKAFARQAQVYAGQPEFEKAVQSLDEAALSLGMKHLLSEYALFLTKESKSIPARLPSRKKTAPFLKFASRQLVQDKEQFGITGMMALICAMLVCLYVRSVITGRYLVNFSIDSIVGAVALVFLAVNLTGQFRLIKIYTSVRDYLLTDVLALVLWCLLLMLWPAFDTSLILFGIAFYFEKRKFIRTMQKFAASNEIAFDPNRK